MILLASNTVFAGEDAIHEEWVSEDIKFIKQLKTAYKKGPLSILSLLRPDKSRSSDLGYGYLLVGGSMGKGYVSTHYQIIYKDDKPISYKLMQDMPREEELQARYIELYKGMFAVVNHQVEPLYYNLEEMKKPLDGCDMQMSVTPEIEEYMTPYSGVMYGDRGGYANSLLRNRALYLSIKDSLNKEGHKYLLCSKNPASRLTGVEYFYSNNLIEELSPKTISRIEEVFSETPTITTMMGCMVTQTDSKAVVKELSERETE